MYKGRWLTMKKRPSGRFFYHLLPIFVNGLQRYHTKLPKVFIERRKMHKTAGEICGNAIFFVNLQQIS